MAPEPLRVLVVDDYPDTCETLCLLLRAWGHTPCGAPDGERAVELDASFLPDVILLDLGLPRMDGLEVARLLRRRYGDGPRPLIISISGWGTEETRRRALEAGCDVYLIKPVDPDLLRCLLARRVYGRPSEPLH